jgi:hypothetical protein
MKTIILGNRIEDLDDLVEAINDEVIKPCEDDTCTGEGCPAGIHFAERAVFVDNSSTPYQYESVSEGSGQAIVRFMFETDRKYPMGEWERDWWDLDHPDYYLRVQSVRLERGTLDGWNIEMKIEWDGDA